MQFPQLDRRPELDALRGFFLVWMTLAHLPTHFSDFLNSPLGFVSSADGFIFISAFLVGRLYIREAMQDESGVRRKLWRRTLKIYGYHLMTLAFAFMVAAPYAAHTHKAALSNLLDFYLAHKGAAITGSVLLLYCPPLLDILPLYVVFLFLTPLILSAAVRWRWRSVLLASAGVWMMAQFGLREAVHTWTVHATHLNIPIQETGAFNLFAWQAVWVAGNWLGARSATEGAMLKRVPGWLAALASSACIFFLGVRWGWFGPHLTEPALGMLLDKWQIGPLRALNMLSFSAVVYWLRKYLGRCVAVEPLLTLGKASLHVFCAHLIFVFGGLALLARAVGEDVDAPAEQLHGALAAAVVAITLAALFLVASREVRKSRAKRAESRSVANLQPSLERSRS